MDIIFYKSTNEVNSFPKTLTDGVTISGTLRSECDILNPVIEFTGIGVDIPYNYCYIPTFKRYYFITEARSIRNDILELSMHVDVLQSWAKDILNTKAYIYRAKDGSKANFMIQDNGILVEPVYDQNRSNIYGFTSDSSVFAGSTSVIISVFSSDEDRYDSINTSANTTTFSLTNGNGLNINKFLNIYLLTYDEFINFLTYLSTPSSPDKVFLLNDAWLSYINSIKIYPVGVPLSLTSQSESRAISLGNSAIPVNGKMVTGYNEKNLIYGNSFQLLDLILEKIDDLADSDEHSIINDFRYYEPISSWCLYLPAFGEIDINPLEYSDYKYINIFYYFEHLSGDLTVKVIASENTYENTNYTDGDNIIYSDTTNISVDFNVPIGAGSTITNAVRGLISNIVSSTLNIASTLAMSSLSSTTATTVTSKGDVVKTTEPITTSTTSSIVKKKKKDGRLVTTSKELKSRNYTKQVGDVVTSYGDTVETKTFTSDYRGRGVGSVLGLVDGIVNSLAMRSSPHNNITTYNGNTVASSNYVPYFIRRSKECYFPAGYSDYVGYMCQSEYLLSEFNGLVRVGSIHLNIAATLDEVQEIEEILKNGVIITSNSVPEIPEEPSDGTTDTPSEDTSSGGTFTPVEPIEPITPIEPETKWLSPWSGSFRVTSTYGEKRTYTATDGKVYTDVHQGLDMVGIGDINIYSIAEGTVEHIGWQNASNPSAGFGYYCRVNTNGKLFYYAHMRADSSTLKVGDTISKGTKIGVMGSTGQVTGAHLHLEVRGSTASSSHENICSYTLLPNEIGTYE